MHNERLFSLKEVASGRWPVVKEKARLIQNESNDRVKGFGKLIDNSRRRKLIAQIFNEGKRV